MRLLLPLMLVLMLGGSLQAESLAPALSPVDNPLKGLVPYAEPDADRFPHSMEFGYLPLSDLMVGPNEFRWDKLEELLDGVASRGNQTVFRIYLEYPGDEARVWTTKVETPAGSFVALRVINPLKRGKALRFANATQDQHAPGWLTLGTTK